MNRQNNIIIEKTWFGGCFVSNISKPNLLTVIDGWIKNKEKQHYITAINVSKFAMIQKDFKLAAYIQNSAVNIADGLPIYVAARLLGSSIPSRITGVELMEDLLELADRNRYRIFFLGAKPQVLEKVIFKCRKEYPGLVIAGSQDGYFKREEERSIVRKIANTEPDILLIAMGIPQKEYFVDDYLTELNTVVSLPVGGAFDVYAGTKKRAPAWVQCFGVEWLWRSFFDKSRAAHIYRSIFLFFLIFAKELFRQRILGVRRN